ncbi:DoxX family protein [Flavobacterium sp. SUN052]|uniref:DoxX family protein n=1 Tax=Flavobacterium sp. SUN052 TaxID=3002441 RepID=UPI00237EDD60|nr:DoxX family protein [Flavobacterium sp. SUN052]MEC4004664.1 DoxX family protein [Flavobacterium sp. SUN052]
MKKIFTISANPLSMNLGLLLIRLIIGFLMAFIGYEKLIHFNELAVDDFWVKNVSFLGMTGKLPLALTIFAEFFCSLFLIIGFLTRFSSFVLLFCMSYIFLVIFPGSILSKGEHGYEFNTAFTYAMIYLGLFFTGPGKYSLDHKLFNKTH